MADVFYQKTSFYVNTQFIQKKRILKIVITYKKEIKIMKENIAELLEQFKHLTREEQKKLIEKMKADSENNNEQ